MVLLEEEVDMFHYFKIVDNYYYILVKVSSLRTWFRLVGLVFLFVCLFLLGCFFVSLVVCLFVFGHISSLGGSVKEGIVCKVTSLQDE